VEKEKERSVRWEGQVEKRRARDQSRRREEKKREEGTNLLENLLRSIQLGEVLFDFTEGGGFFLEVLDLSS